MTLNLVQHRSEPSVWDRSDSTGWDIERWMLAVMAGAFLVSGFRRRSVAGLMFVMGGSSLAWYAAAGIDERHSKRGHVRASLRRRSPEDPIGEASEESFPASDAPSWTATTGNSSGPSQIRPH